MDVSIVIVSYNTCRLLEECIISIKKETTVSYEIIVVDNASVDNTCQMLREKYPETILIENKGNEGFARANNQGFSVATGKYFFMLNPDTVILDGAIDKLVSFMECNPGVGVCAPRNIGKDGQLQYSCDHFPGFWNTFCYCTGLSKFFPRSKIFSRGYMQYWDYGEVRDVERMTGCALLIRAALYKNLGGLDEHYFMYFEETELCLQTAKRGFRTTYFPHAVIIHYGGESSKGASDEEVVISKTVSSYYYPSQYYFFHKNYGWFSMLAMRALDLTYGMFMLLVGITHHDARKKERAITLGWFLVKVASSLRQTRITKAQEKHTF
jgi:GT2 family glycosyltransferase